MVEKRPTSYFILIKFGLFIMNVKESDPCLLKNLSVQLKTLKSTYEYFLLGSWFKFGLVLHFFG